MKFTIHRQAFMNQLANVTRAVPVKATIPVLTGIKIVAQEDGITLIGSDAEISIEAFLDTNDEAYQLEIIEPGSIVVTARLFSEIIKKLPTDIITIETDEQYLLTIRSGQAVFNLNGIDGQSYPHLPEIVAESTLELPTLLFRDLINQTIFSASNQESRPVLTGLHLSSGDHFLSGVATDSHRLSRRMIPVKYSQEELNFESINIPKKTVQELSRIIEDEDQLKMMVADKQVIFTMDNLVIYSRLLEGNYPDTNRLIPQDHQTEIVVDSQEFLAAIERASLMSHQGKNNVVQLDINDQQVELLVNSNERGQASEIIEVKSAEGDDLKISFNPDYMKDALKSFGPIDIHIGFQTPVRPLLLTPAEKNENETANNQLLQLLTPIRTHY
ncbi:DNA polymerase III subunit beta [Ignavigranum ruoffiae]|uniref:DNA polymerase III subunit beta n=1 Tax=Ignavigranum ruoffiae TaxID=89093 RepID=UPI00204EED46|nr:DNA polymerase III subunit beta [Ignavigranum ruoffiae]UPQ86379.1 DNA polymerase III subunit beta [Ignavigranum ruoffiae]